MEKKSHIIVSCCKMMSIWSHVESYIMYKPHACLRRFSNQRNAQIKSHEDCKSNLEGITSSKTIRFSFKSNIRSLLSPLARQSSEVLRIAVQLSYTHNISSLCTIIWQFLEKMDFQRSVYLNPDRMMSGLSLV